VVDQFDTAQGLAGITPVYLLLREPFQLGARAEVRAFDSVLIDADAAANVAIPDRLGDAGE
jgi:hypothetical protein